MQPGRLTGYIKFQLALVGGLQKIATSIFTFQKLVCLEAYWSHMICPMKDIILLYYGIDSILGISVPSQCEKSVVSPAATEYTNSLGLPCLQVAEESQEECQLFVCNSYQTYQAALPSPPG